MVTLRQGLGAEDQQLILVARTICCLEYGRQFRESTVYSDFSAAPDHSAIHNGSGENQSSSPRVAALRGKRAESCSPQWTHFILKRVIGGSAQKAATPAGEMETESCAHSPAAGFRLEALAPASPAPGPCWAEQLL